MRVEARPGLMRVARAAGTVKGDSVRGTREPGCGLIKAMAYLKRAQTRDARYLQLYRQLHLS
jgi:hypothetical protein